MNTYARVADKVVVEVISLPDGMEITDCYHADIAATFIMCPASVQQGYVYDGKKFAPASSPETTTADLISYAAAKRFAVETDGTIVDGLSISTDRVSQSLITGAYNYVQANPDVTVKFKTATGFVDLAAAQMTAIANAVGSHVQAAFATEGFVVAAINAGTITTRTEIDAASWPSNG